MHRTAAVHAPMCTSCDGGKCIVSLRAPCVSTNATQETAIRDVLVRLTGPSFPIMSPEDTDKTMPAAFTRRVLNLRKRSMLVLRNSAVRSDTVRKVWERRAVAALANAPIQVPLDVRNARPCRHRLDVVHKHCGAKYEKGRKGNVPRKCISELVFVHKAVDEIEFYIIYELRQQLPSE